MEWGARVKEWWVGSPGQVKGVGLECEELDLVKNQMLFFCILDAAFFLLLLSGSCEP